MSPDDGMNRLHNDEAARALLKPEDGTRTAGGILPPLDNLHPEVTGTGSGAGGGNAGEDHDPDHTAGSNTGR